MFISRTMLPATLLLVLLPTVYGNAASRQLSTESADPARISGTFTVYLYGCRYPDDIENIALLVSDTSRYPLEIYSPASRYTVKKKIAAQQALADARAFVKCSVRRVWQTQVRRIIDDTGGTVGYEVRPLYDPLETGSADVLFTSYALKNGTITAYIRLARGMENRPFLDRGSRRK